MWLYLKEVITLSQDEQLAFITRALRALQLQIDGLNELNIIQEERIRILEKQNIWSLAQGHIDQAPVNVFVVRLPNGKLGLNLTDDGEVFTKEEVVNDTTD
jgi:hypothetical protein